MPSVQSRLNQWLGGAPTCGGDDVIALSYQRAAIALLWLSRAIETSAGLPPTVVNSEFKFSASVPATMISCEAASGSHPHSFTILLSPGRQGCSSSTPQPYVGLFGDYYIAYDRASAQALNLLCPRSQDAVPGELQNLGFPGHASAVCRRDHRNGWVDVLVIAQAGSWPDKGNSDVPHINYTAQLHTSLARLTGDLDAFKKILATMNISAK